MVQKYPAHNSLLPFFLAWQIEPNDFNYNINFSYQLPDDSYTDLIILKLQELINYKPYLRQTFMLENSTLMGCIHEHLPAEVCFFTSSTSEFPQLEKSLTKQIHHISEKSSIKLNIIRFNDKNDCIILFNIHHIIMDGLSLSNFITELNSLLAGEKIITESTDEYIRKISDQASLKQADSLIELEGYMKEVKRIADGISYPPRNKEILFYTEIFPEEIMINLENFSIQNQISKYNLMLLAWGVFIAKLYNQKYSLVNYPVSVRTDKSLDGCLLNIVTLPIDFSQNNNYLLLIHDWKKNIDMFKKAAKIKASEISNISGISSFINANVKNDILIIENQHYIMKNYPQIAGANLSIRYREQKGICYFTCDIHSTLFPEYFNASLLKRFFNFLNKLLVNPSKIFSLVDLTFTEEKIRLLYDFNKTAAFYPKNKTIIDLFEEQVIKTPDKTAIVYENIKLTYSELNERANQLAHHLRNFFQVKPEDLIALVLDRNENMIITILGVLKSGAAYVPIDPALPEEKISYILDDTRTNVILTDQASKNKLKFKRKNKYELIIDSQEAQVMLGNQIKINPSQTVTPNNLAYIIYTSGTTGIPKGVMIEHGNVINTIFSINKIYKNKQKKDILKIAAFSSYAFDVSVGEFFIPLFNGYELHILSNSTKQDVVKISEYLNSFKINYIYLPPVLLALFPKIEYPSLQGIIYAGEPCDIRTGLYWSKKHKLYNYYGPTETAIYATGLQIKNDEVNLIGKPISNTTAYVLDNDLNPLPIGITGELFISGNGVGRGYLNQNKLTTEKFIVNPFSIRKNETAEKSHLLYKTGDLARWLPNGNLEYIGRNDFQVKIRGYRIELGEIENILIRHLQIQQAVVLLKNQLINNKNDKFIVAYYVSDHQIDESDLYDYCKIKLADYMIPSIFIHLNKIPLTINGKIDVKSLPEPTFQNIDHYVIPENEHEELICAEFANTLGLIQVGANSDFFRLGGNSIKAINLVAQLQVNHNINISISDIYNLKTPRNIAKKILFNRKNLNKYLEKIKNSYLKENIKTTPEEILNRIRQYTDSIPDTLKNYQKKLISTVLLTGATGFLGCNLLKEILKSTNYNVYLLVRSSSHENAYERINKKFQFYFNQSLDSIRNIRLFVFSGDIEKDHFTLSPSEYQTLTSKIDCIIHAAALTKHYGEPEKFYSANVQATINLLEFCKLTQHKNFHYVSTISVLSEDFLTNRDRTTFTEDDTPNEENLFNLYVKTKYQGEKSVIQYREFGISSSIYRVGNLAFAAKNSRTQENSEENGFLNRIKCILNMGIIAKEIGVIEISPVDLTAEAIVKLFDKNELQNQTYHVFNPYSFDLTTLFSKHTFLNVKIVTIHQFIDTIYEKLKDPNQRPLIVKFLTHQGWLNENYNPLAAPKIIQDRTNAILQRLGFKWMPIEEEAFIRCFEKEVEIV